MIDMRPSKKSYYLNIAKSVADRSTCLRRRYGAVIVKDDRIVSTGYNGAPIGRENCNCLGKCIRIDRNIPRGTQYELCRSVHAEMNAIINASPEDMKGAVMYLVGYEPNGLVTENYEPCPICKRLILNAKIALVQTTDRLIIPSSEWVGNGDKSIDGEEGY